MCIHVLTITAISIIVRLFLIFDAKVGRGIFRFEDCLNNEYNLGENGDVFIRLARETARNDNFNLYLDGGDHDSLLSPS